MTLYLDRRAGQLISLGAGDPDQLLDDTALAAWLGVNEQWPSQQRHKVRHGKMAASDAPPYIALSPRRLRYRRGTVVEWLLSRTVGGDGEGGVRKRFERRPQQPPGSRPALLVESKPPIPTVAELVAWSRAHPLPPGTIIRFRRGN